ncbi:MAG: DNA repair protein RecN [Bacteroidales bacterium]|nr:DNA repair protein RecN [Bacteroidales bacterium]MCD8394823.1 DNA repair protein RecN [Bacteroidales bacterium]
MIESLHISNYALIDQIDIDFAPGLNIITGETGAGKSIMIGALSLLLGDRADSKMVTDATRKSIIEATFTALPEGIKEIFDQNDIDWDPERAILRRELSPNGRSRAFVNDSPVTLNVLRTVALQLIDLHSQHQNLLLASPAYQLEILDSLANNGERLAEYRRRYGRLKAAVNAFRKAKKDLEAAQADEEFTRYQLDQLNDAKLQEGEQEDLEHQREILSNVTEIKEELGAINQALDGSDEAESAIDLLREALGHAENLVDTLEDADALRQRLETVEIELRDIADTFADIDSQISCEPGELEAIEDRLNEIYTLQRKHHVDSVEALLTLRQSLEDKIAAIDNSDDTLRELERTAKQARTLATEAAAELSQARRKEALRFASDLAERAIPLGMKNLVCDIQVRPADLSSTGADAVEFLFAFNKNQEPMPVARTASGGEISRLMLSIKSLAASKMQLPSIIFDEVDTGVSGDVANRMGQLMARIAEGGIQVIAITHLPQVASKGSAHYKVYKEDDDVATHTRVRPLDESSRVDELAVMLSGSHIDEAARAAARSLLGLQ